MITSTTLAQQIATTGQIVNLDTMRTIGEVEVAETNQNGSLSVWGFYLDYAGSRVPVMEHLEADEVLDFIDSELPLDAAAKCVAESGKGPDVTECGFSALAGEDYCTGHILHALFVADHVGQQFDPWA